MQRLQFFLSESTCDHERINARRLELLRAEPATAPHGAGVLVIDDSGDRKHGTATTHVGRQWLGRLGKTDNGVVTVTTLWADERVYHPLHAVPYTRARHFPKGRNDPGFRTKLRIGAELAGHARDAGFAFRAVAADSAYGDQDGFRCELADAGLPFVTALKPRHGTWAYGDQAHTPVDAARELSWGGLRDPGDWNAVMRTFRDGHTETWWAADATLGWWGPDGTTRLVVATADAAGQGHLVSRHEPAPPGRPTRGRGPAPGRRPDGDRPHLWDPSLDAELQAGEGRTRVGRLPSPLRHGDPPPPDAGQLRVLVLLGRLVHRTGVDERRGAEASRRHRREGARNRPETPIAVLASSNPGRSRLDPPPGSRFNAIGGPGRTRPHHAVTGPDELGRRGLRPAPLPPELTNHRH
ncbi:transposase [Embleya sp. NPDC050493]|uniref:IS701 family transposase n=1 Tax=Embleya sp. NPDC050493 TaxID=3363989 RepID=UPI0037AFE57C